MSTSYTATRASSAATPAVFDRLSTLSYPLLRIAAGFFLIPHGAQKLFGWFGGYGLTATGEFFGTTLGMQPGVLFALLAGAVEFFGGIALVLGLLTRPAALAATVLLGVALTVHIPAGYFWNNGGIEFPLFWALVTFAVFLGGGGRYSLDARFGLRF